MGNGEFLEKKIEKTEKLLVHWEGGDDTRKRKWVKKKRIKEYTKKRKKRARILSYRNDWEKHVNENDKQNREMRIVGTRTEEKQQRYQQVS